MADKVRLVLDQETDRLYPKVRQVRVTIRTKDGRTLIKLARFKPASKKQLEEKFRDLASVVLPSRQVAKVIKIVADLESLPDISALTSLLCTA